MRKILLIGVCLISLSSLTNISVNAMPTTQQGEFINEAVKKHYIGDVTETFVKKFYENSGWKMIDTKVGRGGIDGLFIKVGKNGEIKDVLITEVKGNNSGLSKTSTKGLQMSKGWILQSLEEKILSLERKYKKTPNLEIKKQLETLKQVKAFVEKNKYRARLVEIKQLNPNKVKLIIKEIPTGISSEQLVQIKNNLKVISTKIIDLKASDYLSNLLKNSIKETTQTYANKGQFLSTRKLRRVIAVSPIKLNTTKNLKILKALKYASLSKNLVENLPFIGGLIGVLAQTAYDMELTNVIERIVKEQELLRKQVNINAQKIAQLAIAQQQIASQIATIADSLKYVKNQIGEIKQGIFLAGLQMLRNYFLTGDLNYLTTAINDLTMARKVKNPELEPIITLYLINAYAEKIDKEGNKKEIILVKEEFQHLANIVDEQNINLLFTAYNAIQDIPFEGKREILRRAVLKVINQNLENHLYDDAIQLAKTYSLLTHDDSIYTYAYQKRLENYNQLKDFKNPQQALEVVDKYQNALLVKEAIKYLYKNNYFALALKVLNSKDPQDEAFQIATYLSIFYYLGDLQKAKQLINLVEENPTYQPITKKAVLEIKRKYESSLNKLERFKSKEAFDIKDFISF